MSVRDELGARIRQLVAEEQLDDHLPEKNQELPWGLMRSIWATFAWIGAPIALYRGTWESALALAASGTLLVVLSPWLRTRAQRVHRRLGLEGEIVPGTIIMANENWYTPENEEPQPATILVSFDPRAEEGDGEILRAIVSDLWELKGSDRRALDPTVLPIAWSLYHEIPSGNMNPGGRLRLPPVLCHGLEDCWMLSAMLPVALLRYGDLIYTLILEGEETWNGWAVLPPEIALPA
jgi:hypothetical protein